LGLAGHAPTDRLAKPVIVQIKIAIKIVRRGHRWRRALSTIKPRGDHRLIPAKPGHATTAHCCDRTCCRIGHAQAVGGPARIDPDRFGTPPPYPNIKKVAVDGDARHGLPAKRLARGVTGHKAKENRQDESPHARHPAQEPVNTSFRAPVPAPTDTSTSRHKPPPAKAIVIKRSSRPVMPPRDMREFICQTFYSVPPFPACETRTAA